MVAPKALLDEAMTARILREEELAADEDPIECTPLGGGVSSIVLLATTPTGRFVLKQPREKFQVRDEWIVDARRIGVEVEFVRAFGPRLPPGAVMPVRAFREEALVAVFDAAPDGWTSWKHRLLLGQVEPRLAEWAGRTLAIMHNLGNADFADRFRNPELFDQQRLDPYYRTSAARVPEVADELQGLIRLCETRQDFVHGDYSPKNFLTDGTRISAIDHEVATRADAAFDVAFLLNHLLLKAVHVADRRDAMLDSARRAHDAYFSSVEADDPDRQARVLRHLGGLQIARATGKSPAEYLDAAERDVVRRFGVGLLQKPPKDLDEAMARVPTAPSAKS